MAQFNKLSFLLFFIPLLTFAQLDRIAQLEEQLEKPSIKKSKKVEILTSLGIEYVSVDAVKSIELNREALELSRETNITDYEDEIFHSMAKAFSILRDWDSTFQYIETPVKRARASRDSESLGKYLHSLGIFFQNIGELDSALKYQLEAVNICQENNFQTMLGYCLNSVGIIYGDQGNQSKAINYYETAAQIADEQGELKLAVFVHGNVGSIYFERGQLEEAIDHYKQCLQHGIQLKNPLMIGYAYSSIGTSYTSLDQLDSAEHYLRLGLKLNQERSDSVSIGLSFSNIGEVLAKRGHLHEANEYLDKALRIYESTGEINNRSFTYAIRAHMYYDMGEYELALENHFLSAKYAEESEDYLQYTGTLWEIYRCKKALGEFNSALDYLEKHNNEKDRLDSLNADLTELEKAYAIGLKESEIQTLQSVISLQNQRFIITIIAGILLLSFIFVIQRNKILKTRNQKLLLERESENLRFSNLLTQIKPHLLFNSLQSIKLYVLENDGEKAEDFLDRYANHFRFILENGTKNAVTLRDEIQGVHNYLNLEKIRHARPLHKVCQSQKATA